MQSVAFNYLSQCIWASCALLMCSLPCFSQQVKVPNASFEKGETEPYAWELSGGTGEWSNEAHTGSRSISVSGSGEEGDSNYWYCQNVYFESNQTYRISFFTKVSSDATGGTIMTGSSFANRDYRAGTEWAKKSFIFTTPTDTTDAYLRFGQWQKSGTVWFDDIELFRVQPVHRQIDNLELGEGEQIQNDMYTAQLNFEGEASNSARILQSHTAGFNSNRWVMGDDAEVIYRHEIGEYSQRNASVTVQIGYYIAGECVVSASKDGKNWTEIGRFNGVNTEKFNLPADWFPVEETLIRLRGEGEKCNFQIYSYTYQAQLDGELADTIVGKTDYVEILTQSEELPVEILSLGELYPGGDNRIRLRLNHTEPQRQLNVKLELSGQTAAGKRYSQSGSQSGIYKPGQVITLRNDLKHAGDCEMNIIITREDETLYHARTSFTVPHLYEADFGYFLATDPTAELWWCEGTYKISQERPSPSSTTGKAARSTSRGKAARSTSRESRTIRISAARNEYEPFQLVLRPRKNLSEVTAEVSDFVSAEDERISAENISISLVEYVSVKIPTDSTGSVGNWPDPLPPLNGSFNASADMNQPLWITVYVPKDAATGEYEGNITLSTDGWRQSIPIRLRVWNFTLPQYTHLRTAFGLSAGDIKRYHHLETDDELQTVLGKYYQNFSEHRISPYYPLAPIRVNFTNVDWVDGQRDDSTSFEGKQSLKVVDDSTKRSISAYTKQLISIEPANSYELSWAVKTEKSDQEYLVTLSCYDADKNWMSGRNIDLLDTGSDEWEQKSVLLGPESSNIEHNFPDEARFVRLHLRPVPWTESGEHTGVAWFDALEFRSNQDGENLIPDPDFERTFEDIKVEVDFTEFDKTAQKAFEKYRFNTFRLRLHGLGGGTFHSRYLGSIAGYQQGTPEHETLFTRYVRKLQDHLEEKGWLDKAYVYWFDEPTPRDYEFVSEGMALIHRAGPKLTRMLTEEPAEPLYGHVDIWCPVTPNYDFEVAEERRKAGEHFWWYICTGPKAPYCTLFIDHYAVELRMWLWQTWKYSVEGILVWRSNYWTSPLVFPPPKRQNPYADPMSYKTGYGRPVGYVGYWGNGDGRFIYPPKATMESDDKCFDAPVNSIRWEMLREGIEDYEYFWLLRDLVEQAVAHGEKSEEVAKAEMLLQIPDSITKSMTEFSVDPKPLYEHRKKIAKAIESLL